MQKTGKSLLAALFWTGVWYLAAVCMGNTLLLPTPFQVLRCLGGLMGTISFWQTTAMSIGRLLLGMAIAVALGAILAVLTSVSPLAEDLISPLMTAVQATPVASFGILVLIWVDRDFVPYQELLKDKAEVTFKLYENLNHAFVPAIYDNIMKANKEFAKERHIGEDVIADIANWIKAVS